MNDWVKLISDMSGQDRWLASSKHQQIAKQILNSIEKSSSKSTGNRSITKTQAQVTVGPSNFMMSEVIDNSYDKYDMAAEILVGDIPMTKNDAIRRRSKKRREKSWSINGTYV